MSGGFLNGVKSAGIPYTLASGVGASEAGLLVKKTTTAGEIDLCGNAEHPIGYTGTSTVDVFGTTQTAVKVGVMPLLKGNVAEFVLLATNVEIAVGDALEVAAAGTVDKKSGAGEVVGYALEAKALNAGATASTKFIKVLIDAYTAAS